MKRIFSFFLLTVLALASTAQNKVIIKGGYGSGGGGESPATAAEIASIAYSIGIRPEKYGCDDDSTTRDDVGLQNAINAAGKNGIILLKRGTTYLIKSTLHLLEGQTVYGYGAKLKSANQVTTTTSTAISTGSSPTTITVASAAGLEVGMQVTVTSGPNGIDGCYNPHTITAINGNQITVSVNFTKAFPSGGTVVTHHGMIDGTGGAALDRIKIYGLEIDGNRLNNLGYAAWQTNYLIYLSGAGVVVRDCYLHDGQSDGIMLGGTGSTVDKNHILRMGGNGIHLSGVTGAKVTNNHIDYCTLGITGTDNNSGPSHAEGTMTWSNLVSNTLVQGNYMGHARAMLGVIDGTDNNDNTITNNTGEDFSLYTVEFKDGTGVDNNSLKNFIFSNNRIYRGGLMYLANPGGAGWAYDAANRSFILSDNLFDHTGIEVVRGKDFRINDNVFDFKNDSVSTIINSYGSSNYSINNNTLLHGRTGIYVQGANPGSGKDYIGSDGSLDNNNLRDQYVYGIQIYGEQNYQHRNVKLSGNTLVQTRGYLANYIGISGSNGVLVEDNQLNLNSGKYGIECLGDAASGGYGTAGTTVRFNRIKTPAGIASVRIGGGTARNVVEFNTIAQAINNGQPNSNVVQANVMDTDATGFASAITDLAPNVQTASYTLTIADKGGLVLQNVATANNVTIPANASVPFKIGSQITVVQTGAGQVTFVPAGGVSISSAGDARKLRVQYSSASLIKTGTDTWLLLGDLIQ